MDLNTFLILIFIIGYIAIAFEALIKINKATSALLMGIISWTFVFITQAGREDLHHHAFGKQLSHVADIVLFLLSTLAIVEIINSHGGFLILSKYLTAPSRRKTLWSVGLLTFFLSAVLGSLTIAIVMISLLSRCKLEKKDRWVLGGTIVVAANAGGAWSPIGDITTTMLWIGGQVSTLQVMRDLFLPSFAALCVSLLCIQMFFKGNFEKVARPKGDREPHDFLIFSLGIAALAAVPIFKAMTGLPAFMGALLGLSVLWLVTDRLHYDYEDRHHLRVPHVLTKVDLSGAIFFLGTLLAINAMETAGVLTSLAGTLQNSISSMSGIAVTLGFVSAVMDNVPLVAAIMGMFSIEAIPQDDTFWQMLAYCAGIGGSILIIGSAPGVAFMGMEKAGFTWYLKKISIPALLGYLAGLFIYSLG